MSRCFEETGQGLSVLISLMCGLMSGVSEGERGFNCFLASDVVCLECY